MIKGKRLEAVRPLEPIVPSAPSRAVSSEAKKGVDAENGSILSHRKRPASAHANESKETQRKDY